MPVRSPDLYRALRAFCLDAFRVLAAEQDAGSEIPFAFEEHGSHAKPVFYEYRPLVRGYVDARLWRLYAREDARNAVAELAREQAARIFARAHCGGEAGEEETLLRSVLAPLLVAVAEGCGGFDWDDVVFDRAYGELERSLFGGAHAFGAVAPLVGISAGAQVELGDGVRVRAAATGELAAHWPEAAGLLPRGFGREPDRLCVLELERSLAPGACQPPDAPGELADAVTALRLATAGALAAGPVVFERLDWRPYGVRPVLPIAGQPPAGEPARLDPFRGRLARDLYARLASADDDADLAEALDRWELSLFQAEPFRSEQLREALAALLGGAEGLWAAALRTALLLGEAGRERAVLYRRLRALVAGEEDGAAAADPVRRALVEALLHGDRERLVAELDEAALGLRPRPAGYYARLAGRSPGSAAEQALAS